MHSGWMGCSQPLEHRSNHQASNGTEEMDNRPSDVVLCMDVNQQMREAYWDAYPTTVGETQSYVPYAAIFREE